MNILKRIGQTLRDIVASVTRIFKRDKDTGSEESSQR